MAGICVGWLVTPGVANEEMLESNDILACIAKDFLYGKNHANVIKGPRKYLPSVTFDVTVIQPFMQE